jgi:Fic family protein
LLIRPALYREAVSTSALEGTTAALFDVLEADFVDSGQRSSEVREVLNYVTAAWEGYAAIRTEPIRLNMIAPLQAILVRGTRGDGYDAGRLRTGQVYIGDGRRGIEQARYIPPPPGPEFIAGVDAWEKWINARGDLPLVVRLALGHYQFEALHPFLDGNGRIGRLIIALQLVDSGAMRYPILNMSSVLEPQRDEYLATMLAVSQRGEYDEWITFFARSLHVAADSATSRIDRLITLRAEVDAALREMKMHRGVIVDIVGDLISYPVITVSKAAELHGVTYPPAAAAIQKLEKLGYVEEVTGRNYGRVYVCRQVMEIVEENDVPPAR